MADTYDRARMIFDLPSDVQMAIRLRAVKNAMTTGDVVSEAIQQAFGDDLTEARTVLADQRQEAKPTRRQKV
jgi:hypothetical protein